MATRFIEEFESTDGVEHLPGHSGIGAVGGTLYARTVAGLLALTGQFSGQSFFVDPANGSDLNPGTSASKAVDTLAAALALCVAGRGDIVYLISDGSTTGTARLTANLDWNKNNTHLVGVSSGVNISNRSRIAPETAGLTFANFFTVSASGCLFQNLQWFHGFALGAASAICLTVTGGRNAFVNCHIAGMGSTDGADAQDAGSRNLKISGPGENQFVNCTIGLDTIARTVANASVEFAGGAPRNVFKNCRFLFFATGAGVLGVKVALAGGSDRWQEFDNCAFINAIKSGAGLAMTGVTILAANIGGLIYFRNCDNVGCGPWGSSDATTKAQIYVSGPITTNTTGIALTAVN
jgi:hypothetical protein